MRFDLHELSGCRGRVLGFSQNDTVYVGAKHFLLEVDPRTSQVLDKKRIPANFWYRQCSVSRLWCRLMRYEIKAFGTIPDGNVIAATKRGIYYGQQGVPFMEPARISPVGRGIHFPMALLVDRQSRVLWGEYWGNSDRQEVHIFLSEDSGCSYEPVKTFSPGQIRHVHGIWQDPYDQGYWVLTGDENCESGIGWLSGDLRNFEWLIHGSQHCRTVCIFIFKDKLIYATDTEKDYNYIFSCDRQTGKVEKVADIPGSCIYGCRFGKWYVVSTTVEDFAKFETNLATLWISQDGLDWKQVWQVEKDIWHKKYFQYGSIVLPRTPWDRDQIVFSGQALKGIDNKVFVADIVQDD